MSIHRHGTHWCRFSSFLALSLIAAVCFTARASRPGQHQVDSLLHVLDAVIDSSAVYDARLQQRLVRYRAAYDNAPDHVTRFNAAYTLFKNYRKFRLDSALHFARVRVRLASQFNSVDSMSVARLNEADALKCLGRLHDALDVLNSIPHDDFLKDNPYYYYLYHSVLLSLSHMTTDDEEVARYKSVLALYRDTVNQVNRDNPLSVCVNTCELEKSRGHFQAALDSLLRFGENNRGLVAGSAIYWYVLGETYQDVNDAVGAKYCYAMSAIIDKRACNKTYTSLQPLAWLLYQEGDTERAYRYITCSMRDVVASNARNRLSLVGEYLPIITTAYSHKQHTLAVRRDILVGMGFLAAVILAGLLFAIYSRNKQLGQMHKELSASNDKLTRLNGELAELNTALVESNKIKEEYIGQLFNMCSSIISDHENWRTKLLGRVKLGKTADVERQLSQSIMSQELGRLFHNFDVIFLELFPDFIERFNALLRPGERIEVKGDNLLSPELRIYALVRLGINDSTKIASFLHYSPQTVYNYRLKVRNRSNLPKEEFTTRVQHL